MLRGKRWGWRQRVAWLALAGLLAVSVHGFYIEPARLVQRDYVLPLSNWPASCNGLRVDVITDIHTGSPRNGLDKLDRLVSRLIASDADIVLMTGDYVILSVLAGTYIPAATIAEHLKPLTARKPVYAVLGNHDWWKNGPQVSRAFAGAGVRMIDNMALPIEAGGCQFWLAGLGDLLEGRPDVPGTFSTIPPHAPVIVITHEPALWPRLPAQATLTIAGHTHGGQINPFGWLTPVRFTPYSHHLKGIYAENGRSLFVSPGIGTSILPMRLGVPPEISQLTLRSSN
ncbi:MAG: metallophosphoesterase [Pseudomonadota bacterium]|nr:metallophosphoesterase [Pseudomonadota bacterium]